MYVCIRWLAWYVYLHKACGPPSHHIRISHLHRDFMQKPPTLIDHCVEQTRHNQVYKQFMRPPTPLPPKPLEPTKFNTYNPLSWEPKGSPFATRSIGGDEGRGAPTPDAMFPGKDDAMRAFVYQTVPGQRPAEVATRAIGPHSRPASPRPASRQGDQAALKAFVYGGDEQPRMKGASTGINPIAASRDIQSQSQSQSARSDCRPTTAPVSSGVKAVVYSESEMMRRALQFAKQHSARVARDSVKPVKSAVVMDSSPLIRKVGYGRTASGGFWFN